MEARLSDGSSRAVIVIFMNWPGVATNLACKLLQFHQRNKKCLMDFSGFANVYALSLVAMWHFVEKLLLVLEDSAGRHNPCQTQFTRKGHSLAFPKNENLLRTDR